MNNYGNHYKIEIEPIQTHHVKEARNIIFEATWELQLIPCTGKSELEETLKKPVN